MKRLNRSQCTKVIHVLEETHAHQAAVIQGAKDIADILGLDIEIDANMEAICDAIYDNCGPLIKQLEKSKDN